METTTSTLLHLSKTAREDFAQTICVAYLMICPSSVFVEIAHTARRGGFPGEQNVAVMKNVERIFPRRMRLSSNVMVSLPAKDTPFSPRSWMSGLVFWSPAIGTTSHELQGNRSFSKIPLSLLLRIQTERLHEELWCCRCEFPGESTRPLC